MELIGLKGTERSLSTPALTKYITQELSTDGIGHDWNNRENTPCKTCTGTGVDREDHTSCIACDGTGTDFYLQYGVEDGVAYAKVVQNGVDLSLIHI